MLSDELAQIEMRIDALTLELSGFTSVEGKSQKRKLAEMRAEIAAAELAVAEAELKLKKARLEAELLEEQASSSSAVAPKKAVVPKKAVAPKKKAPPKFVRLNPPPVGRIVYRIEKNQEQLGIVLKVVNQQAHVGWYGTGKIQRVLWRSLRDNTRDADDVGLEYGRAYKMFDNSGSGAPKVSVVVYRGKNPDDMSPLVRVSYLERNYFTKTVMEFGDKKVGRDYIFSVAVDKDIPTAKSN